MAGYAYAANEATNYALEAKLRMARLDQVIDSALADGVVSQAEAEAMVIWAKRTLAASEQALEATQSVYDREVAVVSLLSVNPINDHIRRKAAKSGMDLSEFDAALATITPFPTEEPFDAA